MNCLALVGKWLFDLLFYVGWDLRALLHIKRRRKWKCKGDQPKSDREIANLNALIVKNEKFVICWVEVLGGGNWIL